MDLTFHTDQAKLNIRVAVILRSNNGYIFCESKEGYYYPVGGRITINESSSDAAMREVIEELNYAMRSITLRAVLENFFIHESTQTNVHEYCFVYECNDVVEIPLPEFFVTFSEQEIQEKDVRPKLIIELITKNSQSIIHQIAQ